MDDVVISVQAMGKRYRIGHEQARYGRLTESLWNGIRAPVERLHGRRKPPGEWIWALRDVSFEVRRGEVVGVIGRNGAGKSTLLKLLSRITEPTVGRATLRGRAGSLLEVGTGFHPELTGRENIYLSGSILGMRRREIDRRFDEIVAFAEVERFLDTPVKRYSSGMQVRLGFAVAAHLETEILIVDEVLAVGDAAFQRKSLAKMEGVSQGGRTVLFVSHSMPSVLRLCSTALLLDRGNVAGFGLPRHVVRTYLETDLGRTAERRWDDSTSAPGDSMIRLRSIRVVGAQSGPSDELNIAEAIDIEVQYWRSGEPDLRPSVNLHFYNEDGVCLFVTSDFTAAEWGRLPHADGAVLARCHIPEHFLAEGRVSVHVAVSTFNPLRVHAIERDAVAFQIVDRSEGTGVRGPYVNEWPGVVRPMLAWQIQRDDPDR